MKSNREKNLAKAKNRAYFLMFLLLILMGAAGRSLAKVSGDAEYVAAAGQQSLYQLDIAKSRGTIYDCALRPITGSSKSWVAAVAPTIEAIGALETSTGGKYRDRLALALENGKPFSLALDRPVKHECIDMFLVAQRYEEDQPAPHLTGYLDSQGQGASGIELAMDDALNRHQGQLSVYYQVDALGRAIAGAKRMVADSMEETEGGVAAAIDLDIQKIAEEASQNLGQGAVVVTEVPNCEIRASVSRPDFQPNHIGEAAQRKDSPLVNRAFQAYAPGSVFKLVTAAVELESGQELKSFTCTGSLNAGGMLFQCYDGIAHGQLDLTGAIENSCNCYFISAARALGGQPVLNMAYNLGLGVEQEFGRGLFTASGSLPAGESLSNPRALANFSFGQGEVTASPLQLCAMMNAIASDGVYSSPKLIAGLIDSDGTFTPHKPVTDVTLSAMSRETARQLQSCLINAAEKGTGSGGAPENCVSGIKTGTAQTGRYQNGQELSHFWYCGFLSDGSGPRYCVTVLKESALQSGDTSRIFREIGERIAALKFAPEAQP